VRPAKNSLSLNWGSVFLLLLCVQRHRTPMLIVRSTCAT